MKWSWKIGRLAGIDLRIHATFLLLLGWIGVSYWMLSKSAQTMLAGIGFILALFGCVMVHEMGHALAARKFGIKTADITLLPIGGLARLERIPDNPKQELWIAIAGPAVNVAIAMLLYVWLIFGHHWEPLSQLRAATGPLAERLLVANISLVLFNLIPAFPMDGGRVLRALLASRMNHQKATRTAAWIGQGFAVVFGIFGFFGNPMLLLIGIFVWIAARQEANAARVRSALVGVPALAVMRRDFESLHSGDTLADAVFLTLKGSQREFPVAERGKAIGILTSAGLLGALAAYGQDHPVVFAMQREFPVADSSEKMDVVFQRLQSGVAETIPVVHEGRLIGLITMEHLNTYLTIDSILQTRHVALGVESAEGQTRRAS